ncbi:MAG: Fe-S cluster assembly ATPase SufC [Candidatus Diapherotrites archaeon]
MKTTLEIKELTAGIQGKQIINNLNLKVSQGEIHAIMGPNGTGKSTLANIIMGNPKYEIISGDILVNGKSILGLEPNERAKIGLFMSFQYPIEIPGLTFSKFLYAAYKAQNPLNTESIIKFREKLKETAEKLEMKSDFIDRELNVGFSGGEKKRAEILQMMILKPKIAILDETDSGLDIDSLKLVSHYIEKMRSPEFGAIVITHYKRLLNHLKPDKVHVMAHGKIIKSGDISLAEELEEKGYAAIVKEKIEIR